MNQTTKHFPIPQLIVSGCLGLTVLFQTLAMFLDYDPDANYFRPGAWLPTVAFICAFLAGTIQTVSVLERPSSDFSTSTIFHSRNRFLPSAVGFLLITVSLMLAKETSFRKGAILLLILSLPYTVLCGLPAMRKHSSALTVLGFAPILSCILLNAYYYFDLSFEMNTPVKMTLQVSLILIMLCYTGELRFLLGRSLPQLYLILHGWAQAVGALCAVSVPIAFVFDRFHRVDYAAGALLIFTVLLTQQGQASRLLSQDTTEKAVPPSSTNFNMADDARESEEPKS